MTTAILFIFGFKTNPNYNTYRAIVEFGVQVDLKGVAAGQITLYSQPF
jgi:hypothetical protein